MKIGENNGSNTSEINSGKWYVRNKNKIEIKQRRKYK